MKNSFGYQNLKSKCLDIIQTIYFGFHWLVIGIESTTLFLVFHILIQLSQRNKKVIFNIISTYLFQLVIILQLFSNKMYQYIWHISSRNNQSILFLLYILLIKLHQTALQRIETTYFEISFHTFLLASDSNLRLFTCSKLWY